MPKSWLEIINDYFEKGSFILVNVDQTASLRAGNTI